MIKGCQKRIIMLNDTGSDLFEQAYFIVKDKEITSHISKPDMIREANRIIENNLLGSYFAPSKRRIAKKNAESFFFFLGMVCGSAFIGIFWAIAALA